MTLAPGTHLGPYEIVARIGEGATGEVYRATHPFEGQVAVKVLRDPLDSRSRERFFREATMAVKLVHRNILPILYIDQVEGLPYYVTPYIAGGSLTDLLKKENGALTVQAALAIGTAIASALEYAHKSGIIHRDVKPSNVLLPTSNFHDALLTDFGLHSRLDLATGQTETLGEMFGTQVWRSWSTKPDRRKALMIGIVR